VPGPPSIGSAGPQVLAIQQQLSTLGYWLGTPDGHFGGTTQQAVFAIQKAAGLPRSGVVDAATMAAVNAGTKPKPVSTTGHVIEVDLARQLVLIVTNGHLDGVLNTSTGGGYVYYDHGVRNVAITPTGHFATFSQVDGTRVSSLGVLWRPKFFVGGIAIHGDGYVPAHPVSHGCVRVTDAAINWIWATNSDPIGTPVWVY
jgi:peptidoglycan hydrolase-like protein with peptidoglycan-binding domain